MKKLIAITMLMLATVAFAEGYAIYSFRASIKRIEPVLTVQKANCVNSRHLSYKQVNDTLDGILAVTDCCVESKNDAGYCASCNAGTGSISTGATPAKAVLYIVRKGDKDEKETVVKVEAKELLATVFGQGFNSAYIGTNAEDAIYRKLNKASLTMAFDFPAGLFADRKYPTKFATTGMRDLEYGLLGLTCLDGRITFSGYGATARNISTTTTIGFCESSTTSTRCVRIANISGSLVGMFNYGNTALCETCFEFSIVDPCNLYGGLYQSPVSGTWSLKYNSSLSGKAVSDASDLDKIATEYLKRKDVIDLTE